MGDVVARPLASCKSVRLIHLGRWICHAQLGEKRVRIYSGQRRVGKPAEVFVSEGDTWRPLNPQVELWRFGDGSMDWAHGIEPRWQLAVALLMDATDNQAAVLACYGALATNFLACNFGARWAMSETAILSWCVDYLTAQTDSFADFALRKATEGNPSDN